MWFSNGFPIALVSNAYHEGSLRNQYLDSNRLVRLIFVAMLHRVHRCFGYSGLELLQSPLRQVKYLDSLADLVHRLAFIARFTGNAHFSQHLPTAVTNLFIDVRGRHRNDLTSSSALR